MGAYDFNAMFAQAQEAGFAGELLPVDTYEAVVHKTNSKDADGTKKAQIGVLFKIVAGPKEGSSVWLNLYVPDATSKPGHAPMFFRTLGRFGCDQAFFSTNPSLEQIEARIAADYTVKRIKVTQSTFNERTKNEVEVIGDAAGSSVPAPPAPPAAAPAAPQAAPVPEAPAAPAANPEGQALPARRW